MIKMINYLNCSLHNLSIHETKKRKQPFIVQMLYSFRKTISDQTICFWVFISQLIQITIECIYTNNNNCENSKKIAMIPIKNKKKKRSIEKSKSRSRHKRNNTFNSSDFSIIQDRVHNSSSVCDLFRNQAIKVSNRGKLQTTVSNRLLPYSRRQKNTLQPFLNVQKKKPKKKVKINKPKQPQAYQRIMLFPSSSQSQIVFSNDDTNRQSYANPSLQKPSITNQLMKKKTSKKIVQVDNWCNQQHEFVVTNKQTEKTIKNKSKNIQNNKTHSRQSSLKNVNVDNSNSQLRLMLSKEFQNKNQAATKIQKVFRGYMTRKILDKYINHEEKILQAKLMQFSQKRALQGYSSYGRQYAFNVNSKQHEESRHYNKQRQKTRNQRYPDIRPHQRSVFEDLVEVPNQTIMKIPASNSFINKNLESQQGSFQIQDSLRTFNNDVNQLQQISKKEGLKQGPFRSINSYQKQSAQKKQLRSFQLPLNISKTKNNTSQKQIVQQPNLQKFDIYSYLQDKKNSKLDENDQSQSSQCQEEQQQPIAYRRRQPIYSQQQISHYLQSSQTEQYGDQIYEPQIIYQTNQQYLQSRKSSLQTQKQVKNQLKDRVNNRRSSNDIYSHKNSQPYSVSEMSEGQTNKQKIDNLKNCYYQQKNFEREDQRNEQFVEQNSKFNDQAIPTMNTKAYTDNSSINPNTYKQSHQNEQIIQYQDQLRSEQKNSQLGKSSRSSLKNAKQKIKIKQLKQQQSQRWDHIIDLISKQVKMNQEKNSEMVSFMKSIIDMSKRNKQRLQGDLQDNQFDTLQYQTPTTTIDHQKIEGEYYSASNQSQKLFFKNNRNPKEKDIGKKITLDDSHSGKTPLSDKSFVDLPKQENNDEYQEKKFKKKKNLQIEIIVDCKDEPLSLKQNKNISRQEQLSFRAQNQSKIVKKQQNFSTKAGSILQKSNTVPASAQTPIQHQSNKIKTFLLQNVQNDSVQQMLAIREQLLMKKQAEILQKLNRQLSSGKLSQQQFIEKLGNMTNNFKQQKQSIDKARIDIEKGFKAAMSLVKQACDDAKRLGIKMSLSRSLGTLKIKSPIDYTANMNLKKVIVDELEILTPAFQKKQIQNAGVSSRKKLDKLQLPLHRIEKNKVEQQQNRINRSKDQQHPSKIHEFSNDFFSEQQSSSSIQFTQQQLQRFRKIQPFDSEFIQMNKNITISEDFIKKHQQANLGENQRESENLEVKHEGYKREIFQVDLDSQTELSNPKIDTLVSQILLLLALQVSTQIVQKPIMLQKMISQTSLIRPMPITKEEQTTFIKLIQNYFPDSTQILEKLNQKISPLPVQLLKCMRIDFSEDDDDENDLDNEYQEIGKYEFIIGQQICTKALIDFKQIIQRQTLNNPIFLIQNQDSQRNKQLIQPVTFDTLKKMLFDEKIIKYIERRQHFIKQRKEHTKGLRWQILNIEVHCIFDAWNEQLIQLRTKKSGFSGIGLNELTLSLIDQNTQIKLQQTSLILKQGKQKLQAILNDESDLNTKLMKQNYEQMCYNDSTWVYYADEAMSYGLQLDYLVEQEIFSQIAGQLLKLKQFER